MSSLKFWIKVFRPSQCIIAGVATYVISLLSNGHDWITVSKITVSLSISISVLGTSLFHYGAAKKCMQENIGI